MGNLILNMQVPKDIIESENLETPKQSTKFLEYF